MRRQSGPTDQFIQHFTMLVRAGSTIDQATRIAGTHTTRTTHNWLRRGKEQSDRLELNPRAKVKKGEELCFNLYVEHKRADSELEHKLLSNIIRASEEPSQWKAAAWVLQRRWPHRWAPQSTEAEAVREQTSALIEGFQKLTELPTPAHTISEE